MSAHRGEGDGQEVGMSASPQVAALAKLVHGSLGNMSPTQRARGLERLTARLEQRRGRRPVRLLVAGGMLAVAAVALLVGLPRAGRFGGSAPLAYTVEAGVVEPGGTIVGSGEPVVRFVDGSSVKLDA